MTGRWKSEAQKAKGFFFFKGFRFLRDGEVEGGCVTVVHGAFLRNINLAAGVPPVPPCQSDHFRSCLLFKTTAAVLPEHLLCAFHLLQGFEPSHLKSQTWL